MAEFSITDMFLATCHVNTYLYILTEIMLFKLDHRTHVLHDHIISLQEERFESINLV